MTIFKRLVPAVLLSAALFAAGMLLQEALKMYMNDTLKTHPEAVEALKREAEKGNTDAAFLLGTSYKDGKVGEQNIAEAIRWYREAAGKGDADAMLMLGWLYYKGGPRVPVNVQEAKKWFREAAARGVDEAVEMLEILNEGV